MHIIAWVALESGNAKLQKYQLMQCIKESSTLRISPKQDKPSSRIVFRYGKHEKEIKNFLKHRELIKESTNVCCFRTRLIFPPALSLAVTSLLIRAATVKDVSSIVRIRLGALTEEEICGFSAPEFAITSSTEKLRKVWRWGNRLKDGFEMFLAEDDGRLVGYMMFKVEGDSSYIDDIVVAKEEQGKGVGRALVAYAEDVAESEGCRLMKTDTTENADGVPWKSYGFWMRMGYEDTGERLPTQYDFKEIPLVKRLK